MSSFIAYNRWKRVDESLLHDFATEKLIYYDIIILSYMLGEIMYRIACSLLLEKFYASR